MCGSCGGQRYVPAAPVSLVEQEPIPNPHGVLMTKEKEALPSYINTKAKPTAEIPAVYVDEKPKAKHAKKGVSKEEVIPSSDSADKAGSKSKAGFEEESGSDSDTDDDEVKEPVE